MAGFRHPESGYVFVVTYGRSGSTLIQSLLNAIPGYLIRGENNNALFGLYKSWLALSCSPDIARMRKERLRSGPEHPWFGAEAIDTDAYCKAICATFAQHVLRPSLQTRVCGFKEIRTISDPKLFAGYLAFLRAGFPQARFVFNTRNAEAVSRSSWWRRHDPDEVKAMVAAADRVFADYVQACPDHSVLLRYDAYTADHGALEPLFELLGDRPEHSALQHVMRTRLTHAT